MGKENEWHNEDHTSQHKENLENYANDFDYFVESNHFLVDEGIQWGQGNMPGLIQLKLLQTQLNTKNVLSSMTKKSTQEEETDLLN